MTRLTEIRNGRVVTPSGIVENGHVVVDGDRITRVGRTPDRAIPGATTIDANGQLVMPGLIDLHGDDIEHHRSPRSGADVDLRTALTSADRTNLLNGVTTKFHAIAFEDAPDDGRSLERAESIARELAGEEYTLGDNRFHARCELTDASVSAVERLVEDDAVAVDLLSVMCHLPGDGQYDADEFERHYVEDRNWPAEAVEEIARTRGSIESTARRDRIDRIVSLARRSGIPVASHDDESSGDVEAMFDHGVEISEYPITIEAARRATSLGLVTAMGAPNLVRGGSLWDNLSVRTAVEHGLVDVLCSDYHPPSLLAAPFVETGEPFATRVNRVTRNPADTVGLTERGRIEVGARADLIVVDPDPTPTVTRVFVDGTEAIRTGHSSQPVSRSPRPVGS
ncbi:alpha-D-ribose 1-methylphosphonate 5-triphosphate diphosphatase [Halopenitus persicus]|uniref:alpha-D-ribose 1-methylphosphonate 5-triphosphate diphosphatase n=1 Tax=Halopenitus persicus TaxID=1048396 RepID=UPI000BBB0318|nr:alpha-D-ribose 1-methylphosphonate 5-triphosphate diphosphatase [Halopenitus persicus]